jgi:hypothetical protein
MIYLATTRFNETTFQENQTYTSKNNINGVIYGSPLQINKKYPHGSKIYVIEMNNELNEIIAISLIKNKLVYDKKHNIYKDYNFNRYIYKGNYRLERQLLMRYNLMLVEILDMVLFKGKTHLKRIAGIAVIKEKLLNDPRCLGLNLLDEVRNIFNQHYCIK